MIRTLRVGITRLLIVASCFLVAPYLAIKAGAVSLDDIVKMKERFEEIKAVKYTNEFKEHFDRVMEPFELFDDLYGKMVDAQTGRDPWKIEERPSWFEDPLGRLIKNQADGYEKVADALRDFGMPATMFAFETSPAAYPNFWKDWEACDHKAAEALTNDLGKIEIMLSALSDAQEKFRLKAKEAKDVRAVWEDAILRYIDYGITHIPRVSDFDPASYLFGKGQAIRSTILGGSGNREALSSDSGLVRVEKTLNIKLNEMAENERKLLSIRASLSAGLSRYQSKCITTSVVRSKPAPPRTGFGPGPSAYQSTITGLDDGSPSIAGPTLSAPPVSSVPAGGQPSVSPAPPRPNSPTTSTPGPGGIPKSNVPTGVSSNYQSTITGQPGVSATYEPITPSAAQAIVGRYKSVPGGVTLEWDSPDLSFIKSVAYAARTNAFILNDSIVYLNPVSQDEFAQIDAALAKDDKLGVSLGDSPIVFGALPPRSTVALKLDLFDRFLGSLVFNNREYLSGYRLAPGYNTDVAGFWRVAVYFNVHEVRFAQDSHGELKRSNVRLSSTLVPLSQEKNKLGGLMPDFAKITRGDLPSGYVANLRHLQDNISYYARERIVGTAMAWLLRLRVQ